MWARRLIALAVGAAALLSASSASASALERMAARGELRVCTSSDVKGVLGGKDLESNPQIKALRQRVEAKLAIARELAAEKSKIAAKKAKDAASTANAYAHDEPWQIAAGALAAGVLIGLLLGRR